MKLKAETAREIYDGTLYDFPYSKIFYAAYNRCECIRFGRMSDKIIKELESLGYTVQYHDGEHNPYEVSWNNPK